MPPDLEALRAAAEKAGELHFGTETQAVFNGHVNKAGERALLICMRLYADNDEKAGMPALLSAYRDGIMAIFNERPTPAAEVFARYCFAFANETPPTNAERDRLLAVAEAAEEYRKSRDATTGPTAVQTWPKLCAAIAALKEHADAR